MKPDEYIAQRLDDQITWYDKKSGYNQRAYKRLRIFEIVAASAIPLLSGAHALGNHGALLVGVLGAAIAICSAVSALSKFHELWLEYRTIAETLRHHKYLYLTESRPYHQADAFALLVEAVEGVISKENSSWNSLNRNKGKPAPEETALSASAAS